MNLPPPLPSPGQSNLAFALNLLPRGRRGDAMLFYRFCRAVDDIADNIALPPSEREKLLGDWVKTVEHRQHPEIEHLLETHAIERCLLLEIMEGCASDIRPRRFESFTDLESYCRRVACVPGLVCTRIFGCRDSASETYAVHLGHALQLTNILRDAGEDARLGRIYIPLEVLDRFGVSEREILESRPGEGFRPLMAFLADRAAARHAKAIPPAMDFRALLPARVMANVYFRLLQKLEDRGFPVLEQRISLWWFEKFGAALAALAARPSRDC